MGLHHLVGSSVGPGFDLQEKLKLAKNYSSFIRDKCCHLTLHLRLMEPNWWFNTVSLQLKALTGQGFELKPLTIRRRGHFKRQDSRSLSPKNQKVIFVSSHLKHLQQVRFFSARMVSVPVTPEKKISAKKIVVLRFLRLWTFISCFGLWSDFQGLSEQPSFLL